MTAPIRGQALAVTIPRDQPDGTVRIVFLADGGHVSVDLSWPLAMQTGAALAVAAHHSAHIAGVTHEQMAEVTVDAYASAARQAEETW